MPFLPSLSNMYLETAKSDALRVQENDGKVSIRGIPIVPITTMSMPLMPHEAETLFDSLGKTCTRYKINLTGKSLWGRAA